MSSVDPAVNRKAWLIIGVMVAAGSALVILPSIGASSDTTAAVEACKSEVRERLKTPSTANFLDVRSTGPSNGATVTGSVLAENSLGGTVQSAFSCSIRNDRAYLDKLEERR